MTDLSFRQYLKMEKAEPIQGIRSCCAPDMRKKTISLRSLTSGPRIIHISDLHFTTSDHTWDWVDDKPIRDEQNSMAKWSAIKNCLINLKSKFGANVVVITGDLTDSGDEGDYNITKDFIQDLRNPPNDFVVFVIPGNHDYCWEGNLMFAGIFQKILELGAAALLLPGAIEAQLLILLPEFLNYPGEFKKEIIDLITSKVRIGIESNSERRQKFIDKLTPEYIASPKYPHVIPINNGYLVLLDSMQAELDEKTRDPLAQGKLGEPQLSELRKQLKELQSERKAGKKVIVSLHHSPLKTTQDSEYPCEKDSNGGLNDADEFLGIIANNIDCLLYGHTSPKNTDHQPSTIDESFMTRFRDAEKQYGIPIINCENLEHMSSSYSVSVLDLGSYRRVVYKTDESEPERSWGNPS